MSITKEILKYLAIFTFFVLVLSFLIFPATDLDLWMHLVSGKYILENFKIPASEFYSYTALGKPWIDHEWLAQAVFYTFYKINSYNGVILLRAIIFLLIFSLFFLILNKKTNCFFALLASFLALLISNDRFFLRPEVFTLLFTIIYLYVLEEYRLKPTKLMYLLPILQVFWVNLHGYFLLGIVIPVLFLAGQFFENKKRFFSLVLPVTLILAANFINPYFYRGAFYPFKTLAHSLSPEWRSILMYISELKSPFLADSPSTFWFKFLIVTSAASFFLALWAKRLKISRLAIYLLFLALGLSVKRHQALFAFSVILLSSYNLKEFYKVKKSAIKALGKKLLKLTTKQSIFLRLGSLILLIALFCAFTNRVITNKFYLKNHILKTFDLGLTPELFPEKAVDLLLSNDFKGHIFNDMIGGSYLVWRYYPKRKVFLDGRTEVYGTVIFKDYLSAFRQPDHFDDMVKKYGINYILLNHSLGGRGKLVKYLLESKDWAIVYFDQTGLVFIKNIPENKTLINKFSVNLDDFNDLKHPLWTNLAKEYKHKKWLRDELFPYGFLKLGYLFVDLGKEPLAKIAFEKALEVNSNFDLAYSGLGNLYSKQKLYPQALAAYSTALAKNPDLADAYYNLGRIYEKQNLTGKAEEYYKIGIGLNPYSAWYRYDLGFLYFNQRRFSLAIEQLKKAVRLSPNFGDAYRALAASLANRGEKRLAKISFQKAISLIPNDSQLNFNLGLVLKDMGKYNAALGAFREVLRLDPKDLEARHHLAISYLSVGETLRAQKEWLTVKKEDPDNKLAKEYLKKLERLGYEYAPD